MVFEVCRLSELKGLDLYKESARKPVAAQLELSIPGQNNNPVGHHGGTGSADVL